MTKYVLNEVSYHGQGSLENIKNEVLGRRFKKALIVTDKDLVTFGVATKVTNLLDQINFEYELFTDLQANPTVKNVQDGVAAFKAAEADSIITIGGGSPQDTAKGIGIVINNPEFADVVSLEGLAETKYKAVPTIAIATTAGTASEVTVNYVITDTENHRKLVCVDAHAIPSVAIVDPEMMSSMPKSLTASTGMDALTHAIEGYITAGADEMSDMFHGKAIELISRSLRSACDGNIKGFEGMALGQYIAGMGFSNVGLGAVHSMAHPLGALYDTPHGVANAIILPTLMEYNAPATGEKYREIARFMGVDNVDSMTQEEYRTAAVAAVTKLGQDVGIPANLDGIVKVEDLEFLAKSAFEDACRPGNPRELDETTIIELYKKMM